MLHALTQLIVVLLIFAFARPSFADPAAVASKMFSRLTGTPLFVDDPRRVEMETAIVAGDLVSAAKIATQDPGFYNVTLRRWAAPMSNRGLSPRVQLNDFTAIIVGLTRDDLDFRLALTGDIRYVADPNVDYAKIYYGPTTTNVIKPGTAVQDNIMYGVLDPLDIQKYLVRDTQTKYQPLLTDYAGLLTTRAWAQAHLVAGTNRRAIAFALENFLCRPIQTMRVDSSVPDDRVRRDVDRYPSGDNTVFQTTCRTCHAMMDGIGGGYAYFDFVNNAITQSLAPVGKYNQNVTVYPAGFVTTDNGWLNRFTTTQNEAILSRPDGTPPPSSGKGIRAVGTMFANSKGFSSCMTKKVLKRSAAESLGLKTPTTFLDLRLIL